MYDGGTYTSGGIVQNGPFFHPWKKWFAWRPVKLNNGSWCWGQMIFRRAYEKTYVNYDDWTRYQYGTLFDVIANPDQDRGFWE